MLSGAVSKEGLFVLGEQPVIDGEKIHAMQQPENDDRIAPHFGIEFGAAAVAQKILRFLQRCTKAEAQAQKTAARGVASPCEDLMQIDLAHAGLLGERGFG